MPAAFKPNLNVNCTQPTISAITKYIKGTSNNSPILILHLIRAIAPLLKSANSLFAQNRLRWEFAILRR